MLRDMSKVSGGVDAVLERDPAAGEGLGGAEATAQDQALLTIRRHMGAAALITGSSASAGASVDCHDAATLEKLAKACEGLRQAPPMPIQEPGTVDGVELAMRQAGAAQRPRRVSRPSAPPTGAGGEWS